MKGGVNGISAHLVKNSDRPKCLDKWSNELNTEVDIKEVFGHIFKTTYDSCLRWFQYRLLYRLLPTGHFLFLRKMVNSPRCSFCNEADETLLHMFWDCPKTCKFWLHLQSWIHTNFTHCDNLTFTKEIILFGSKINIATDRILDLFILMAKHHIFTAKIQGTTPHLNTLTMKIKSRFLAEKYYYTVNNLSSMFTSKWMLYLSYFS